MSSERKDINVHLNNLLFSLYHSAQSKQAELSKIQCPTYQQKERAQTPRLILEMLLEKTEPRLTEDEKVLLLNLLKDLGSNLQDVVTHGKVTLTEQRLYRLVSHVFESEIKIKVGGSFLHLVLGDLMQMPVDAVVSPENTILSMDKGVSSIIRLWGGEKIHEEARKIIGSGVCIGSVVVTSAGDLAFKYILHAIIMEPHKETTRNYIKASLDEIFVKIEELEIQKIAMPAFGTASVKFPYDICAKVMLESIIDNIQKRKKNAEDFFITLYNHEAYDCFIRQFKLLNDLYHLPVIEEAV